MTIEASILPFIHAQGSWGEIGRQVGQMFQPAIERHVEAWTRHIVAETGCARSAVEAAAAPYARPIQDHTPFLWEELDGMSRGSGIPTSRLLILQARGEILRAHGRLASERATFAIVGDRTGGLGLIVHQVDSVPFVAEYGIVIRLMPKGFPAAVLYTSAGSLDHLGIDETGVSVATNAVANSRSDGDVETPSAGKRRERFEELLREAKTPLSLANVQESCRDHENAPHSPCAHPMPGRHLETIVSVIGDLTHGELHATKGAPCRAPYATYTLATCRTGALSVTVRDDFQPAFSE